MSHPHLRVARATDRLDEIVAFYRDGLGFTVLGEFHDHEGFDGVMLGLAGGAYHLEFTHEQGATAGRAIGQENLLVFYLPEVNAYQAALARMQRARHSPVKSHNPYWDAHGTTFEDADGYRVVLQHGTWPPARP